jgi:SAM-dependent methyltransferase
MKHGVTKAIHYLMFFASEQARSTAAARNSELEFDIKWGVNTSGIDVPTKAEVVGSNWLHGADYQAVSASGVFDTLSDLAIEHDKFTFIDFGSGKGRAILMASRFPFKRVIGVEYSKQLNDIAKRNLAVFPISELKCKSVDIICADAATFPIPQGPLVIFLYNPFGRPVMQNLVDNVMTSFLENPRRVIVLYFNAVYADVWKSARIVHESRQSKLCVVYDTQVSHGHTTK